MLEHQIKFLKQGFITTILLEDFIYKLSINITR